MASKVKQIERGPGPGDKKKQQAKQKTREMEMKSSQNGVVKQMERTHIHRVSLSVGLHAYARIFMMHQPRPPKGRSPHRNQQISSHNWSEKTWILFWPAKSLQFSSAIQIVEAI